MSHGLHAYDNCLREHGGAVVATFSSHWAAVAAMIRLSDPAFVSMGGDREADLEVERELQRSLAPPVGAL